MIIFESDSYDAAFHFSVEELFTCQIRSEAAVLMLWQTGKTVMLGNNQIVDAEVDIRYAQDAGICIVRRSSGGGAIYTDRETVLYTVIQPQTKEADKHREEVAASVIRALNVMGVPAIREGRNDILVDGRKISGFAQYASGGHICTHGSLLFDTDLEILTKVLIANENKLRPKGIASIRSRVTNIKPYLDGVSGVVEFIGILREHLLGGNDPVVHLLSADELEEVKNIFNKKYSNREWNMSK